jgi:hypothetical protein
LWTFSTSLGAVTLQFNHVNSGEPRSINKNV